MPSVQGHNSVLSSLLRFVREGMDTIGDRQVWRRHKQQQRVVQRNKSASGVRQGMQKSPDRYLWSVVGQVYVYLTRLRCTSKQVDQRRTRTPNYRSVRYLLLVLSENCHFRHILSQPVLSDPTSNTVHMES